MLWNLFKKIPATVSYKGADGKFYSSEEQASASLAYQQLIKEWQKKVFPIAGDQYDIFTISDLIHLFSTCPEALEDIRQFIEFIKKHDIKDYR